MEDQPPALIIFVLAMFEILLSRLGDAPNAWASFVVSLAHSLVPGVPLFLRRDPDHFAESTFFLIGTNAGPGYTDE